MANVHYLVDLHRETGAHPPTYVQPIWDDYLSFHATRDTDRAHQQLHQSQYAYLDPDEERFITPEIIRNFCLAGQPHEIIERLHELEGEGTHGVNSLFQPTPRPRSSRRSPPRSSIRTTGSRTSGVRNLVGFESLSAHPLSATQRFPSSEAPRLSDRSVRFVFSFKQGTRRALSPSRVSRSGGCG
jgi:hypothetical protein